MQLRKYLFWKKEKEQSSHLFLIPFPYQIDDFLRALAEILRYGHFVIRGRAHQIEAHLKIKKLLHFDQYARNKKLIHSL